MRRTHLFFTVGVLLAGVAVAKLLSSLLVEGLETPGEVPGDIGYFRERDSAQPLGVREVWDLPETAFVVKESCCDFGNADGVIWLRFKVTNDSTLSGFDPAKTRFLTEVVNPFIPRLTYYHFNGAGVLRDSFATGSVRHTFRERPDTNARNFRFPLVLPEDSTAWVYFRIESEIPLQLRILFFEASERLGYQQWIVDILMTIFYVFSVLFLVLSVILIAVSREYFNWYYSLYIFVTTLFIPAHLGLGFMYLWPQYPDWQQVVPMALNVLRLVFGIQFFRYYANLPRTAPRFDRFARGSVVVFLVVLLLQSVGQALGGFEWVFYPFFVYLMLFSLVMLVWILYEILLKRRARVSALFLVIALNFVGVAATSMQYLGYSPAFFDITDDLLKGLRIANTFFLPPFVIAAFFLEMLLVFYFSVRRFLNLIEKNQRAQLRLAQAKEEGLNALILGVENERKRIARELHDGACVNLAAINMKVDLLREELSPALAAKVTDIAEDLDATYREVRNISHDLMSKALEKTGLRPALEELAHRYRQPTLSVQLFVNYPLEEIQHLARIQIYRIVQELLGNVLKHARASAVNVQLLEDEDKMLLSVEDNGQGFDPLKTESDGIGLANVRTRAEVLRGALRLESAPGRGTFVSIEIPKGSLKG
jgi:signal transduction histidine kinase